MKFAKNLEFDLAAVEDLSYWVKKDRRKAEKILDLVQEIGNDPFRGTGKPEPLKFDLSGCWSRRIDQEHRIVYSVEDKKIRILSCRFHYK
ncbi:MAG: addiction module antitoxin [uncultured bacterium]|nr:MAG: addiction module antitoxin [uncultured bacterium]OFW69393.1 MAG: addiction module protein [Alphaproteobacteria bacterium GWC2_42_16]OFW74152.1 MAG: addiction module protein [Alphaproteobacteria bacterium GWA2_41_27]OFW84147.1 MAG: addiction module protein [Alphaproteobacteria bacterium RIFCSPHIGHO2_12_FULL_42_100]OFW84760.1 MAG: addiction module protein [Alphaproteobacteria bacterium RBG_16_42_14]OFW90888.1 MAG: addiction module protein [Alphaproteobacteria bacterium RIFCSPHIGHO2_12_42